MIYVGAITIAVLFFQLGGFTGLDQLLLAPHGHLDIQFFFFKRLFNWAGLSVFSQFRRDLVGLLAFSYGELLWKTCYCPCFFYSFLCPLWYFDFSYFPGLLFLLFLMGFLLLIILYFVGLAVFVLGLITIWMKLKPISL